jgi:hypothetical protein
VVLGDALRRLSVLGGREGMPRSLGSVLSGFVTLFLGGSLRGVKSRVGTLFKGDYRMNFCGFALSRDGTAMFISAFVDHETRGGDWYGDEMPHHVVHKVSAVDGSVLRSRRWAYSGRLCVACDRDGCVLLVDSEHERVEVLSPALNSRGYVGEGVLRGPEGVCANADVVVVACTAVWTRSSDIDDSESAPESDGVVVLDRRTGTVRARFGACKLSDAADSLCLVNRDRHVAIADCLKHRVSLFSLNGEFIRHVGVGRLKYPSCVACGPYNELVVGGGRSLWVFDDVGKLLKKTSGHSGNDRKWTCSQVAVHGSKVFALHEEDIVEEDETDGDHYPLCVVYL